MINLIRQATWIANLFRIKQKFVIFSKKLLCKIPILFIHPLDSRKVC
jgi:hypothetical protein